MPATTSLPNWLSRRCLRVQTAVVLQAAGLIKNYGDVQALRGADLDVGEGQIVSLLGRNGAGKTTMLSIIAGLLAPDAGSVSIGDVDVLVDPEAAAKLLGIAPQETGIYPILTVRQNLEFFGELAGLGASRRPRAVEVADQLGLGPLLDRKASQLSGGEGRRLHTACALVHRPRLLMLDEPTVGADVATRLQLIEAVRQLAEDGAAVVYTTHYLPEVEALDADIVIIDEGQVRARGTQEQLVAEHRLQGVRFTLDGEMPPELASSLGAVEVGDSAYRALGDLDMRGLLGHFGDHAGLLTSVEELRPDLETVFLAVTGHRLDSDGSPSVATNNASAGQAAASEGGTP